MSGLKTHIHTRTSELALYSRYNKYRIFSNAWYNYPAYNRLVSPGARPCTFSASVSSKQAKARPNCKITAITSQFACFDIMYVSDCQVMDIRQPFVGVRFPNFWLRALLKYIDKAAECWLCGAGDAWVTRSDWADGVRCSGVQTWFVRLPMRIRCSGVQIGG